MDNETMKQQFKEHGFEQVEYLGNSTYRLNIMSDVTGASYPLYVKTATSEKGGLFVHFEEADFEENDTVPLQVRSAALDKLKELKLQSTPQSVEKNKNGSMAQNLDEMKKLGKEMNHMKTGSQHLEEENLIPDPLQ
jgi:phage terminase large subunit